MKKITFLLESLIDVLVLPFRLLYYNLIKPFALKLCKDDINNLKSSLINSYQKNKELSEKIESLEPFLNRSNRLKDIVEKYKDYQIELSLSQEKELILIIYRKENPFNYIWLFGEKNENQKWNAQLALTNVTKHHIRIEDFLANPRNKGYGTILLRFLIQLAKHHDIKEISGDLVIEDKERLKWLIPFYKNMGFSCQLSKNQYYPQILGKINLRAKSPDEV